MVNSKNLSDHFFSGIFNALSICLQYTVSLAWPGFDLKCLVTVMPKVQSPRIKVSVWNFPISEIDSNCNSILRPADSKWVTIKFKRKV